MATPRDIRVLAFQACFELDAREGEDREQVETSVHGSAGELKAAFSAGDLRKAWETGLGAYEARREADAAVGELAPTWPAVRQPAVDRAILRLAYYELVRGSAPGRVIVNEAVELAKAYSTERSPAFVNGVLDKLMKHVGGESSAARPTTECA